MSMRFGVFTEFETREGQRQPDAFRDWFEVVDAAEAWGLDGMWLGEIHFTPARSVLSAPIAVASAVATRTRRMRIGLAVQVLPLNHPLRIAEEAATLDHMSGGRLDFGIGRSGVPRTYDVYGIPYKESQARFAEALDIILRAWTGEPFSHAGAFYRFENATVVPRPVQRPHPPLRMAATTEETFPRVGQMGLPIFVGLRAMDVHDLGPALRLYRQAWREAGHPGDGDVYLRIPVYAAATERAATEEPYENTMFFFERQANLQRSAVGRDGIAPAHRMDRFEFRAGRLGTLAYEQILKTKVAFGTAARLVDRFTELQQELGLTGIVAELNPGGLLSLDQMKRSLHILAHDVIPAFR
jgi:alkanesulfonate monooxygenase SsuD/methylene tetrahydromethanopterin reductase-like flavin-dependent oxidoreductase (luciferase family)